MLLIWILASLLICASKTPDVSEQKEYFTDKEKARCYSLDTVNNTVIFIFDETTWADDLGDISVTKVEILGSFNGWESTPKYFMTRDSGYWYLTKAYADIRQPGNSGQPEYKFKVNNSWMDGNRAFIPEGYIFMNSDKNQIIVFPDDDFETIKSNSAMANTVKTVDDFDLTTAKGKKEISNFREVPGGTNLFRSYHTFKTSNAAKFNTEDERISFVTELAVAVGIQSYICLSDDETATLTSYIMPDGNTYTESILACSQSIFDKGNILYVGQSSSTTPEYNAVYYESNGSIFGNWIKETVQFIISDSHPAPFLIHCRLGTDRTGVFSAVLAALLGASWNDIASDYQLSNNMGIKEFRDWHLLKYSFENMLDLKDITAVCDLKTTIANYFITNGYLTQDEINSLIAKLNNQTLKIEVEATDSIKFFYK